MVEALDQRSTKWYEVLPPTDRIYNFVQEIGLPQLVLHRDGIGPSARGTMLISDLSGQRFDALTQLSPLGYHSERPQGYVSKSVPLPEADRQDPGSSA